MSDERALTDAEVAAILIPEMLGVEVRRVWLAWAREQPNPKPSWLVPWEELSEPDREVDRRIGMAIATLVTKPQIDEITALRAQIAAQEAVIAAARADRSHFNACDACEDGEICEIGAEYICRLAEAVDALDRVQIATPTP